jgi:RNA polymerase sigma-70 factor (ECF subfamily)
VGIGFAVERAKAGDRDAIRFLYVRFGESVYWNVRSVIRNDHDAEDVTQQVFVKLMTHIDKYEPRAVPFSAWIARVAHNMAVDYLRRTRLVPCEEIHPPDTTDHQRGDRAHALKEALRDLPEEQREVLLLRHVLGLSPSEIATRLGRSEGSVHGLHHRGRSALKQALLAGRAGPAISGRIAS